MSIKRETFIGKMIERYGTKYDPNKVIYKSYKENAIVVCPEHGEFSISPKTFLTKHGCPKCDGIQRKMTNEEFKEECRKIYGDKYDYTKTVYKGKNKKIIVTCPTHGDFEANTRGFLSGTGCPYCDGRRLNTDEFIRKAKEVHGDKFDYSETKYVDSFTDVTIICKKHGRFKQNPHNHLKGAGCPMCVGRNKTNDEFINECGEANGWKYQYDNTEYKGAHKYINVTCPIHGTFRVKALNHLFNKSGCPKCSNPISRSEMEIRDFISSIGEKYEVNNRTILDGNEIDILITDKNIGIEFDGIHWHSELFKDKNYHLNKTEECKKHGIRLIHIFEDEWIERKDIWKSMLCNLFGKTNSKIFARKCVIKEVDTKSKTDFLNDNHIQGNVNSKINLGLYYNDELVSLMTFGKERINLGGKNKEGYYELSRFCNKIGTTVIGGASKLFKFFIEEYNPIEIISYSDKRWSDGKLYAILGFEHIHDSRPNYFYVIRNHRENRFKYRKDRLVKEGFDKEKSEHEIMKERGIYRIYDCGTMVHIWKKQKEETK